MSFYKNPIFLDLDMQGSPRTEISEKLQNFTIQYLLPWFVRYFSLSWYNINRIALIELLFLAKTFDPILRYCMTVLRRRQLMMRAYCHAHQLNLCPQCSWNRRAHCWSFIKWRQFFQKLHDENWRENFPFWHLTFLASPTNIAVILECWAPTGRPLRDSWVRGVLGTTRDSLHNIILFSCSRIIDFHPEL